jgi:5-methylcytosine-specific restriction enzyme subunit McrC
VRLVELVEDQTLRLEAGWCSQEEALRLHQHHHHLVQLEFPSPLHPAHYLLRSRGWAGQFTAGGLHLLLRPKVPLGNLFGMMERAYGFQGLEFGPGEIHNQRLGEMFGRLAGLLARGVQARLRQGLYREYREGEGELGFLRGRLLFPPARRPGLLRCLYHEHSAEIPDNHILAWTLHRLRQCRFADPEVEAQLRRTHHLIADLVEARPVQPEACVGRTYHRLNQEYRPLHGLCRFFLEHSGPLLEAGDHPFTPFAVHLPTLFERFVASWLHHHLPRGLHLEVQHRAPLEGSQGLAFRVDLVLRARPRGPVLAIMDTKYKNDREPASEDVQQVVAYAVRLGAPRAFLIYPSAATQARRIRVGGVQVRTLAFALEGDLEASGQRVCEEVLAGFTTAPGSGRAGR